MNTLRATFVCLLLAGGAVSIEGANDKPNILLIMADDVGSDAIGCYGGESYPTPHIDSLAHGGLKFNHGYAMPVCHPSRVSIMTGRYPFRFGPAGMKWGDYPKAGEAISIGHVMKRAGYATCVAGKWQVCTMKDALDHPRRLGFDEWQLFGWHEGGRYRDPLLYENGKLLEDTAGKYGPDLYVEFLIDFMERSQKEGKPFFAYYPMALCHDVTDDLKDENVAFYQDVDDMIGRLIAALDRLGVREETLVIFTTDNGTPAGSYLSIDANGKMTRPKVFSVRNGQVVPGGKGKFDDTGTRVPFIANWPGRIQPGGQADELVDLTDILPTLAEVAGLEDDGVFRDGISFAPLLFGAERSRQRPWIYSEHRGKRSVRSLGWRLHGNGRLYNLKTDPLEKSPLPKGAAGVARRERARLQGVLDEMQGKYQP
jgi:arylsulfatase A-like enzyme